MRLDHVVILVHDLVAASDEFAAAGFSVVAGGTHSGGVTHNALISFADGSYIELLAFRRRLLSRALPVLGRLGLGRLVASTDDPMTARFIKRALNGFGLADYALRPSALERDLARARRGGVRLEGPIPGGRTREDGEVLAWLLALPKAPELPFLCSDVTERTKRVPPVTSTEHSNGAVGITSITVAVQNLEASSARYRALTGAEPETVSRDRLGNGRVRVVKLEGTDLVLATPGGPTDPIRAHLRAKGEGPSELTIAVADEAPGSAGPIRLCGTWIRLVDRPRSK